MVVRYISVLMMISGICMAQLPDRDELKAKLKSQDTSHEAAEALLEHFAMGGIRTIIRNLNDLDATSRLAYGNMFRNMDMFRFRDDLNNNLSSATDNDSKAMYLMLISSAGRQIAQTFFEPYVNDETLPTHVRLAAAGGMIKIQNPGLYDKFLAVADSAVVDPGSGKNDLYFANITKENIGFFLYAKGKIEEKSAPHGAIICAIQMAESGDTDVYEMLLKNKKRKYYPMMIDHAVQVGGTALLETMANHKTTKKFRDQISKAQTVAAKFAEYWGQRSSTLKGKTATLMPYLPIKNGGTSQASGYHSAYAIAKISSAGDISLIAYEAPFGDGNDNLKTVLSGKTMAANIDFAPVESIVLVTAP